MKDYQKEKKQFKTTLDLKNRNKIRINDVINEKIRSFSLNNIQLENFIPILKPINVNINPSPIKLKGKEDIFNIDENFTINPTKKYNKKFSCKIKNSEKSEKNNENKIYSNEEEHIKIRNIAHISSNSSENDSKGKENIKVQKSQNNKDDNNMNLSNKQNKFKSSLSKIKGKIDIIKNNIKCKYYKDDSILYISFKKYLNDNYRIKCAQNYINKLKLERTKEYNKFRNKTISFKDIRKFKPPILGFLQMNEISTNSTLSSGNLSEI